MALALLLLAAAALAAPAVDPVPDPPASPTADLHEMVVEAIRNCGQRGNEIVVCTRDMGFAAGEAQRVKKLVPPRPVSTGAPITVQVTAGPNAPPPPRP